MSKKNAAWRQLIRNVPVALSILMLPLGEVSADNDSRLLFQADQQVYGKKLNEWSAEWWQYILSTPQNPNPLLDTTGGYCTIVQHGPVWFLEGAIRGAENVTRDCSIPEGKALFFPLLNLVDINTTNQPVSELRAEIAGCLNAATNISLKVDGHAIASKDLLRSRVRSIPFAAVLPADGVPTDPPAPAGIYSPAIDDGYYVMLKPLSVGAHTLHFTGSSPGCDYAPTAFHVDPFALDVTYNLTVVNVRGIAMAWDQIEGKVKETWGDLTDDEIDQIAGKRDVLLGKIQERYGMEKSEAERRLRDFEDRIH